MTNAIKGHNVFLSGPMAGREHYNAAAFAEAHSLCAELGANHVYDPVCEWWKSMHYASDRTHAEWMRWSVNELTNGRYDVLVRLDEFEYSEGAMTEFAVAMACGMRVVDVGELREMEGDE